MISLGQTARAGDGRDGRGGLMGKVDPGDDAIWRWVIHHYRFDPVRNERRNVVVAGYDTAAEFESELDRYSTRVRAEISAGTRSDREHVSGMAMHPGYRTEQALAHAVRRAVEHGADLQPLLSDGPLPSNTAVFGMTEEGEPFSYGGVPPGPSPDA